MPWEVYLSLASFSDPCHQTNQAGPVDRVKMGSHTEKVGGPGSQSDDRVDVEQVDTAAAPAMLPSFAHLDEKAILRKVRADFPRLKRSWQLIVNKMDMRLIPMLALLYLLSFLDRTATPKQASFHPL